MVAAGEISPVELVTAHLQQIERINPALNAVVAVVEPVLVRLHFLTVARFGCELVCMATAGRREMV